MENHAINNQADWLCWCIEYLDSVLARPCLAPLYSNAQQRRRIAEDLCRQAWLDGMIGRRLLELRILGDTGGDAARERERVLLRRDEAAEHRARRRWVINQRDNISDVTFVGDIFEPADED